MAEVLHYICPFCGSEVRVGTPCKKCRETAKKSQSAKKSSEQDGATDGLDLPTEDFDYDEFVAREFGKAPHRKTEVAWYWWALAVLLLVALIFGLLLVG